MSWNVSAVFVSYIRNKFVSRAPFAVSSMGCLWFRLSTDGNRECATVRNSPLCLSTHPYFTRSFVTASSWPQQSFPCFCRTTVYPKKYAHGFCFHMLCCGYTLTDFPISIRLTSLSLWQSNDCPSASKATLMNMDKYFMWIHYERLHDHNKAKHNKTVCIFLGIYCTSVL